MVASSKVKKSKKSGGGAKNSVARRKRETSLGIYHRRLLRTQIDKTMSLSARSSALMDKFVSYISRSVYNRAAQLAIAGGRGTVRPRHILYAAKLELQPELARCATVEAKKAIALYNVSKSGDQKEKIPMSVRSELVFPVSRIRKAVIRQNPGMRMGPQASVGLAGLVEYTAEEFLTAARTAAKSEGKKGSQRVQVRHLAAVKRNDDEFNQQLKDVYFVGMGTTPMILPKYTAKSKSSRRRHKKSSAEAAQPAE